LPTEKMLLADSVVPSGSHTMEELETLCPQIKYFHTSAFNLQMFPIPMLLNSCVINDDVILPLKLQSQCVMQSC
uniref:Uncharacterized protein n=1 Tax=Amphimedon queenslandica TaxID=400682 RepID=A0A1X7UXA2_AMPQE